VFLGRFATGDSHAKRPLDFLFADQLGIAAGDLLAWLAASCVPVLVILHKKRRFMI
jgi:hypothetical protein